MSNRRLGVIFVIIIILLIVVAILVTKSFDTPHYQYDSQNASDPAVSDDAASEETASPEPTPPPEPVPTFDMAPEDYFNDALIIGDSRTEGMRLCADIPGATFFCSVGMGVTGAFYEAVSIPDVGTVTLDYLLSNITYGKIYIMLGINDIGGSITGLAEKFGTLIDMIREKQPDALIIIEANLRVTASYNSNGVNNERIDEYNQLISEYADNEKIFYLDVNPLFDDGTGRGLNPSLSPDGLHVPGAQYIEWANWIMNHAVVFKVPEEPAENAA